MSDSQCLGVCMIDPDTGACLGCGRLPEEIAGVPTMAPSRDKPGAAPLPPQVAAAAADPLD